MSAMHKLRLFHLALAAAAAAAFMTGKWLGGPHRLIGYAVAAVLIVRLLAALMGKGALGWRSWVPRLQAPASQSGWRHPAISRALTLALLASIGGAATTGILMDGGRALANPAGALDHHGEDDEHEGRGDDGEEEDEDGRAFIRSGGEAEHEGEGEEEEGALGELHELFANLLLPLAGIHILYVLLSRTRMATFMLFWPQRRSGAA